MKSNNIKARIREYFFLNPTARLRVRQIEKAVKVPLPSAIRYAKELEKEGLLKSGIIAGANLYSADRSSKNFIVEKMLFNIRQVHESGLVDYLVGEYSNPAIILFGSYARGEDIETSDIDIYIETSRKEIIIGAEFEKKLQRAVQAFTYKSIKDIKNRGLANNIVNGVRLNGNLEVI